MLLRTLASGLVLASLFALSPGRASAQSRPVTLGGLAGWVQNAPVWSRDLETESVGGVVLGAWVDVPTPAPWLSVTAEATYTQRGSGTRLDPLEVPGALGVSAIRTDYVTASVLPRARVDVGPVRLHGTTGPTMDLLLRSRVDVVLEPLLDDAATAVFAWTLGAGLGAEVAPGWTAEIEARLVAGLGSAYSGDLGDLRNRSFEILARVGVPR